MACESFVQCRRSGGFSVLLTTDVPKISPNLNVVGHLAVPAGWGSCLLRLAIFSLLINAVIALLNCLVLILHLCIHFLSLRLYFL